MLDLGRTKHLRLTFVGSTHWKNLMREKGVVGNVLKGIIAVEGSLNLNLCL